MARQKSISKRLSKHSRYSASSAILDPDTGIFGYDDPYWWKNLGDHTEIPSSADLNMSNETSRQLNSNSQIENIEATDSWWKVLKISNIPNSSKLNKTAVEKDSTNNVLTSESEEESGITKKKFPLHLETRKSKGNVFLNVLNDSATITFDVVENGKKASLSNNFASSSKTTKTVNVEEVNESGENSLNQSQTANNIVKLKPNIFKKKHRNQNENIFVDILKEQEFKIPLKRKCSTVSSSNESRNTKEHSTPIRTEASATNQAVERQSVLSVASDHDYSNFPAPNAQSTVLEDSNSSVQKEDKEGNCSDKKYEILKPKSKLLTRNRKNTMRNRFKNVLEDQEILDKTVKDTAVNEISKDSITASNVSEALTDTVDKGEHDQIKRTKRSNRTKIGESIRESSMRNEISGNNSRVELSKSTSDISEAFTIIPKLRSRLLTKSMKNQGKNLFQDILTECMDSNLLTSPKSKRREEKEKDDSGVKKNISVGGESKRSSEASENSGVKKVSERNNTESENLHLKLSVISNKDNNSTIARRKNESTCANTVEIIDKKDISKRQSKNLSDTQKRSSLRTTTNQISAVSEKVVGSAKRKGRNSKSIGKRSALRVSIERRGTVSPEIKDTTKRQSSRLKNLQESSFLRSSTNESAGEDKIESTKRNPERDSRRLSETQKETVSVIAKKAESLTNIERTPKRQNLSKVQKHLLPFSKDESEKEEVASIPERRITRSTNKSRRKEEVVTNEVEDAKEIGSISKRQSVHLSNRSQKESTKEGRSISKRQSSRFLNESAEEENVESTKVRNSKGDGRKLSRMQKKSVSVVVEEDKSRKRSFLFCDDETEEEKETESIPNHAENAISRNERSTEKEIVTNEMVKSGEILFSNTISNSQQRKSIRSNRSENEVESKTIGRRSRKGRFDKSEERTPNLSSSEELKNRESGEKEARSVLSEANKTDLARSEEIDKRKSDSFVGRNEEEEEDVNKSNDAKNSKGLNTSRKSTSDRTVVSVREVENTSGFEERSVARSKREETILNDSRKGDKAEVSGGNALRVIASDKRQNLMSSLIKTRDRSVSKGQKSIVNFLKPASQVFLDTRKAEEIKRELEKVKEREIADIKGNENKHGGKAMAFTEQRKIKSSGKRSKPLTAKEQSSTKKVHKAFLVNGQAYRVPRLPRPQRWITDRLYNYLWKRMEPRYKLETRVASEKFVRQLANVTSLIIKRKSYLNYKPELYALMKEMARLGIIHTRNDFYHFCYDFFPYELRVKTVPILLPGNKRNIPYDAETLHTPILDS